EEALKNAAVETVEALSRVVEVNDPYTAGHSSTVTEIAIKIAQEMGLRNEERDTLRIAAPLHDVGKVGISSAVLNKPARLTQAEWVMIQAHPVASAQMAERVTAFKEAVPIIRHHHERWDGTGYPDGLKGEEIPLLARILAVADGFEAMTSERPYRWARTEEEALAELKKGAGSQWDPKVVEVFVKMYEGGIIS
ncbi:MAG: HD-GYP domain-containing protein, partial [Anaerolineae bacterium]